MCIDFFALSHTRLGRESAQGRLRNPPLPSSLWFALRSDAGSRGEAWENHNTISIFSLCLTS
jgi:hypothetical protein